MLIRFKDVDRFREIIIVDKFCVDREEIYYSDDVAIFNKYVYYLKILYFN